MNMSDPFSQNEYLIRRKVFTFLGAKFHVYDANSNVVLFSQQKAFKLKEDIRVYNDESKSQERLLIMARQIIDFSAAYDVVDSVSGRKVGALRRKGWSSLLRDSWEFLNNSDVPIGTIKEDSAFLAALRRFVANIIPQSFIAEVNGQSVARYDQSWNPFIFKLKVTLEAGSDQVIDPRLVLAGGILLTAIEGRQKQ
jgi:uncharacterized protein YxjI